MATLEEMGKLRKELLEEDKLRERSIKEMIEKLSGYMIPDLLALRERWVGEAKKNRKLYPGTMKKRREAELWIEAIDTILKSPKVPEKTKKAVSSDLSLIEKYIDAIERLKLSTPALADLERASGIKPTTWHRHLNDPAFVMGLKKEMDKKVNNAKTRPKKLFWTHARSGVEEVIKKIYRRIPLRNSNNLDVAEPDPVPDTIDPGIAEVMKEDINRRGRGSNVDGTD